VAIRLASHVARVAEPFVPQEQSLAGASGWWWLSSGHGESPEGKGVQIPADMAPGKPILRLQWRENGQRKTEDFLQKYTLVLNLGKLADGNLPGKIHAEFPDATKSKVSGSFVIEGVR
jgi:hypothetical protein